LEALAPGGVELVGVESGQKEDGGRAVRFVPDGEEEGGAPSLSGASPGAVGVRTGETDLTVFVPGGLQALEMVGLLPGKGYSGGGLHGKSPLPVGAQENRSGDPRETLQGGDLPGEDVRPGRSGRGNGGVQALGIGVDGMAVGLDLTPDVFSQTIFEEKEKPETVGGGEGARAIFSKKRRL